MVCIIRGEPSAVAGFGLAMVEQRVAGLLPAILAGLDWAARYRVARVDCPGEKGSFLPISRPEDLSVTAGVP